MLPTTRQATTLHTLEKPEAAPGVRSWILSYIHTTTCPTTIQIIWWVHCARAYLEDLTKSVSKKVRNIKISNNKGRCDEFETELNIIAIVQKVWKWPNCYFCQNGVLLERSFWRKDSLVTLIFFELWLLWYLAQSQIHCITLYLKMWPERQNKTHFSQFIALI